MPSREGASELRQLRVRFRNAGWLLDVNGSADWEEYATPSPQAPGTLSDQDKLLTDARELAQRYRGGIVRLRRLPDGYRVGGVPADVQSPDARVAPQTLPERSGVVAIVSEGWPGSPVLKPNWRLIGPLTLLQAAEAARGRADHGSA